jgi:tRNA 2-thiouridine synthesizing protein C
MPTKPITPKKILLVNRNAPYGNSIARESLDVALAGALFNQQISLLFMDDGVFQLLNHQDADSIEQKNIASLLSVLPLYDVDKIYVHQGSLTERQLSSKDLIAIPIQALDTDAVKHLINQQDHLLSF